VIHSNNARWKPEINSLGSSSLHQPKTVVLLYKDRRHTGACHTVLQRDMSSHWKFPLGQARPVCNTVPCSPRTHWKWGNVFQPFPCQNRERRPKQFWKLMCCSVREGMHQVTN